MIASEKFNYLFQQNKLNFLIGIAASVVSLLLLVETQDVYGIQYLNYSSEKYQIQFQYPSDWILHEKTDRFEEGNEIKITSNDNSIWLQIGYSDDLVKGYGTTDLQTAVTRFLIGMTGDYSKDYQTIESPSFTTIDGQRTGTFLFTMEDKYETVPIKSAMQVWITFVGSNGYNVIYISTPDVFDIPENIEIRDHFIKSIKFLGAGNATQSNQTSRFN